MAFDRSKWLMPFKPSSPPNWPCPRCSDGVLLLNEESLVFTQTREFREALEYGCWENARESELCTGQLVCSHRGCQETVVVCARSKWIESSNPDMPEELESERVLDPVFFYPAPPLFPLPANCPESVAVEAASAWPLFWADSSACGNRIRSCIEAMLANRGIPSSHVNKNGRRTWPRLHDRIRQFSKQEPVAGNALLAIKLIGNDGSHASNLGRDTLLDGIELLELAMHELYDRGPERIEDLASKYIKVEVRK